MKSREGMLMVVLFVVIAGAAGCAGARPQIRFDTAKVPVSMSKTVLGRDGRPLGVQEQFPVGRFTAKRTGYAVAYSFAQVSPFDFSEELNRQVGEVKGDAVVNLQVSTEKSGCTCLNIMPFIQALPIYPGCVEVSLEGDIIRSSPPTGAARGKQTATQEKD